MHASNIAAVRVPFGSDQPMTCLRGSPSREGDGIFYQAGVSLEVVRYDENLKKHILQVFHYGALGPHGDLLFSTWGPVDHLAIGASYAFAGFTADVRFPNRMSLKFNQEKSLQKGRQALLNARTTEDYQGPVFIFPYAEMEIQKGKLKDIWFPQVLPKRGQSGCAVPGSPLANFIEAYKNGGFDVGLETTDLELFEKLAGTFPNGDLFIPAELCANPVPQTVCAHFAHDYGQWTVVTVESLAAHGLDRTLKEFDEAQVQKAERKAEAAARKAEAAARKAEAAQKAEEAHAIEEVSDGVEEIHPVSEVKIEETPAPVEPELVTAPAAAIEENPESPVTP